MTHWSTVAALIAAVLQPANAGADDFSDPGRRIFERRCQSCHAGGSDPGRETPGTFMQARVQDSKELDDLLNYLETLRQ